MTAIESPLRNKIVSFGSSGVGLVSFLQDYNCIPHVTVQKVNPEVGKIFLSSLTPHHWAHGSCQRCWEGDPIGLVLPGGGLLPPSHAMLDLAVFQQQPRGYPHITLWSLHPLPWMILI